MVQNILRFYCIFRCVMVRRCFNTSVRKIFFERTAVGALTEYCSGSHCCLAATRLQVSFPAQATVEFTCSPPCSSHSPDMHNRWSVGANLNVMVVIQDVTPPWKLPRQNRTSSSTPATQGMVTENWSIGFLVTYAAIPAPENNWCTLITKFNYCIWLCLKAAFHNPRWIYRNHEIEYYVDCIMQYPGTQVKCITKLWSVLSEVISIWTSYKCVLCQYVRELHHTLLV